ncbi:MAG: hypothetical protein ACRCZS_25475 [Chroococcidiopsis sp.]
MSNVNYLGETAEEERWMDFYYGETVDEIGTRSQTFSQLGNRLWAKPANNPLTQCSNKYKPLLETRAANPNIACPWDVNPRVFLKVQRKVASRRWRRAGRYNGQTFDDFEAQARSRFSALEDRLYY